MKKGLLLFCILVLLMGCGFSNIINRGEYVDEKSVSSGAPRYELLARFGSPIDTKKRDTRVLSDVFRVVQGETTIGKVLKGGSLFVVDVCTFGLAEIVATPVTDRKEYITFEVQYDKYERSTRFMIISEDYAKTAAAGVSDADDMAGTDIEAVPATRVMSRKNAFAIVVGIENYRQKLPKAEFAVKDAKLVREYLVKAMGYPEENIITLINENATKSDFEKYFERWLTNNVEKDGTVFIYYSGHGAPNPKTGDAYIVPYDGDPSFIDHTGYSLKRMYQVLGRLPAKEIIVTMDSCFSGAGGRSVLAKGTRPLVMNLQGFSASPNMTIMTASSADQISSTYEEKGHGLFTYFLLKGIKNEEVLKRDGTIAINDLFIYVKPQVERIARKQNNCEQSPQLIEASGVAKN
jgi:hypothetical protein